MADRGVPKMFTSFESPSTFYIRWRWCYVCMHSSLMRTWLQQMEVLVSTDLLHEVQLHIFYIYWLLQTQQKTQKENCTIRFTAYSINSLDLKYQRS